MGSFARRVFGVAAATLALCVPAAAGALGDTTVKTGRWHGLKWTFAADDYPDGFYCVVMTMAHEPTRSCGPIHPVGISGLSSGAGPAVYVVGPVIAKARSVEIKFFDRSPVRTPTIKPPRSLIPGIRFFVVILPCPATEKSLVARNAEGRIVAQLVMPRLGPKPRC